MNFYCLIVGFCCPTRSADSTTIRVLKHACKLRKPQPFRAFKTATGWLARATRIVMLGLAGNTGGHNSRNKKSWPNPALQRAHEKELFDYYYSPPPLLLPLPRGSSFYAFALCCTFFYYECVCVGAPPICAHTSLSTNCWHTIYSYSRCFFFVVRKNMILNKFKMHLLMCARCILCILCFARPAGRQTAPRGRKKLPQTTTESDRGANPRRGPVA